MGKDYLSPSSPSHLCLLHLFFYLTKHIIIAQVILSLSFSPVALNHFYTWKYRKHNFEFFLSNGLMNRPSWTNELSFRITLMFFGGENCDLRSSTTWVICDYKGIFLHFPKENSMLCISQPCCLLGLAQRGCDPMAFANKQICFFAFSGGKLMQSPVGFSSSKDTKEEEVLTRCKLSLFLWVD